MSLPETPNPVGYKLNHHPSQHGIWFKYDGGRYKDVYNIKLHSGEVRCNMFPNGNGWFPHFGSDDNAAHCTDEDVAEVMLTPDKDLSRFSRTGVARVEHSVKLFGAMVPCITTCIPPETT